MKVGIFGCRPSLEIPEADLIVDTILKTCVPNKVHINIVGVLGFNMKLLKKLPGGMYDIYMWNSHKRMTKNWHIDGDKDVLWQAVERASRIIVPPSNLTLKKSLRWRNNALIKDSDKIILISPTELEGDLKQISEEGKEKCHHVKNLEELEKLITSGNVFLDSVQISTCT
jgi:hypothetical protein